MSETDEHPVRALRPPEQLDRREFLTRTAKVSAGGVALALAAPDLRGATAAPTDETPHGLIAPGSRAAIGARPKDLAPDELVGWLDVVYSQVKAERCTPPSAARIYGHVMLAAYEVAAAGSPHLLSLAGRVNGFDSAQATHKPNDKAQVSWPLAMNEAIAVAAAAVFSNRSAPARQALADFAASRHQALASGTPAPIVTSSLDRGRRIGQAVAARADADGYLGVLGRPYTPPVGPDKWIRTPPNFGAALEPYWGEVRSFALLANDECRPIRPVPYSEEVGSAFWHQADTVYQTSFTVTDDQRQTALFWRDNPDGSTGLPSGHWMLIASTVIRDKGLALDRAAEILALAGIATADGFTSCWTEKYESNLLRPVSYVRRVIDPTWNTFVNSPAFPEYTSGHSVGSGAAAGMLTHLLGDNVGFLDTIGRQNGYPDRSYRSFWEAADQAALSRLWGGIHYPMGIEQGVPQGAKVAELVAARLPTRK